MKIKPIREKTVSFGEDENITYEDVIECCDSYMAVLTQEQIDKWFEEFEQISASKEAAEYTEFGTTTMVFEVDGKNLVVVSDSGGEYASGEFLDFCNHHQIDCQFAIDSLDCEGVDIDDIYTGSSDDNQELLTLIHKVYN